MADTPLPIIHILRHGESLHNVQRGYPYRDPPLTPAGEEAAKGITLPNGVQPDIILVSPMTRTIQTALHAFPSLLAPSSGTKLEICPDLREAHDAECNKGVGRQALAVKFPQLQPSVFESLPAKWDYPEHSIESARERAESVRNILKNLGEQGYKHIVIVTHRCIAAFLVQGLRFQPSELRSFEFAGPEQIEKLRIGAHCETGVEQDYGPTLLVPWKSASSTIPRGVAKDEAAATHPPILLLLNGFPGVGKYTIAKSLLSLLQSTLPASKLQLIDNHSVIDIVLLSHEKHSPAYYAARKTVLRTEFFDKIREEEQGGMVVLMTSVFAENEHGVDQWADHVELVRERGWVFVHVNLGCEAGVNEGRLVSEERVKGREIPGGKKKQILPWRLKELRSSLVMIDPKNHADELHDIVSHFYEIDVTNLSADESAAKLREILKECRGSLDMSLN